jgi:glucose uptake protein GlcU
VRVFERATSSDLKHLAWVLVILWGFIGVLAVLTRGYFEHDTIGVAVGLAVFVTVVFALIVGANLLVVALFGLGAWLRRCRVRS